MVLKSVARGQMTIIDLTDSRQMTALIGSSNRRQVIYNPDTKEFLPNYATVNNVLSPELYLAGSSLNKIDDAKTVKWTVQTNSMGAFADVVANQYYAFGAHGALVIKDNIFKDNISMLYRVAITYHDIPLDKDILIQADIEMIRVDNGVSGSTELATVAILTNDAHTVSTDYQGNGGVYTSATTSMQIFEGATEQTSKWVIKATPSTGVTGTLVSNKYTLTGMTIDTGYVDLRATKGTEAITKRFTVTKSKSGYTPIKGTDFFDGKKGEDGESSYLWIRYSKSLDGAGMTTKPTGTSYMGTTTTNTPSPPLLPSAYQWVKYVGNEGIPGAKGDDGKSSYLHIKYSNDGGVTFTGNGGEDFGDYLGKKIDNTLKDSTIPSEYIWGKITGEDATSYQLLLSPKLVKKTATGALDATTFTATGKSQKGLGDMNNYAGRFTIEEDAGAGYVRKYTSAGNEISKAYTISNSANSYRVRLYQSGATSVLLDEETLTVVSDGATGSPGSPGANAVLLNVSMPDGDIIKNHTGNLKAVAELFEGVNLVTGTAYQWYARNPGGTGDTDSGTGWNKLTTGISGGTTGFTSNTLTITPSAIPGTATFMVIVTYKGKKMKREVTVQDITDTYTFATIGNGNFKNGQGSSVFTQKVYQDGIEVDKTGSKFRYQWNLYNNDGTMHPTFVKVGKTITVLATDYVGKGYLFCQVTE